VRARSPPWSAGERSFQAGAVAPRCPRPTHASSARPPGGGRRRDAQ
jgi:hypothetical protein